MRFGDAGIPGGGSDALYDGATGDSPLSLDYYRARYGEFQSALNAADRAYKAVTDTLVVSVPGAARDELIALAREYESNFARMRAAAQAMNAGAGILNAVGVRMPVLSIPNTLGLPIAIPAAVVAAVGTAAALVSWVREWSARVREAAQRAERESIIANAPPEQQAALRIAAVQATRASEAAAGGGILGNVAGIVKWLAIGAGVYLVFKAVRG